MEFNDYIKNIYLNKITKRSTVFFLELYLTNKCQFHCKHCFEKKQPRILKNDMMFDEVKRIVIQAKELSIRLGIPVRFSLIGGDPLMHPNFKNIAEYIGQAGFAYTIKGNPISSKQIPLLKLLKENGLDRYQISIDGMDHFHDRLRGSGAFKKAIFTLLLLRKIKLASIVRITLFRENKEEIIKLISLLLKLKTSMLGVSRVCGLDDSQNSNLNMITADDCRDFLSHFLELIKKNYKKTVTQFDFRDHLWFPFLCESKILSLADYQPVHGEMLCACSMFHNALCVMPGGKVFACSKIPSSFIGDIYNSNLLLLQYAKMQSHFCDVVKYEKCSKCDFANGCMGCPAISNSVKSMYSPDPQCWVEVNQ